MNKLILSLILSTTLYSCPTLTEDLIQTIRDTNEAVITVELVNIRELPIKEGIEKLTNIKKDKEKLVSHILSTHSKDSRAKEAVKAVIEETIEFDALLNKMREVK
ncbi:MAG: hypothetical protein ACRDBY_13045 [Cetobacterium sp.]